jgi:hypothetical protein
MTEEQAERIRAVKPTTLWAVPEGSWLMVRQNADGTWIEVLDPKASNLLAWDFPA